MRRDVTTRELRWIDIVDPSDADLKFLRDALGFHPLDVAECRKPTRLPKVESRPTYLFLVIHVPSHIPRDHATIPTEFDIFVAPDAVVTVHPRKVKFLDAYFRRVATGAEQKERALGRGPAYLLYSILEHLFETTYPMLDHIVDNLERAEKRVFAHEERRMVTELTYIQRDLMGFRSVIRPQRHLYAPSVLQGPWATPALSVVFQSLHGKLSRLWDHLEALWERADALAGTNNALLNYKLNTLVEIFTIVGTLFIPLGLMGQTVVFLAGDVPLGRRLIFWMVIWLMLAIDAVILWGVRRRRML